MKLLIIWSGEVSRRVGTLLRDFFSNALKGVEPFLSEHDLDVETPWAAALAAQLRDADFAVVCLTREDLTSPWLLFEAGALTVLPAERACCLLFDGLIHSELPAPLAHYWSGGFTEIHVSALLQKVNERLLPPIGRRTLPRKMAKWWAP